MRSSSPPVDRVYDGPSELTTVSARGTASRLRGRALLPGAVGVCASRRVCSRVPLVGDDGDDDQKESEQRESDRDERRRSRCLYPLDAGRLAPAIHYVECPARRRVCQARVIGPTASSNLHLGPPVPKLAPPMARVDNPSTGTTSKPGARVAAR